MSHEKMPDMYVMSISTAVFNTCDIHHEISQITPDFGSLDMPTLVKVQDIS
jgi:hypothetical protein